MKLTTLLLTSILFTASLAFGDNVERERPVEWKNLVFGGQFKDLILPMPIREGMTSDAWGANSVKPRDVYNGIEDPAWSYWCGDPIQDEDGVYHLYTARWPENHAKGHFGYFDSIIVHATAHNPLGPYQYRDTLGEGHNPEIYKSGKGNYIVYRTHGSYFESKDLHGPWKRRTYEFDRRERYRFKNYVNFSFAPRDDGSYIAVSRRGWIWASPDGEENWYNVSSESVYPKVPGIFEDPVLWKDDIQYHIIVNDWKGRIAYYLRSKDGFHWKTEPGEAYAPGLAKYEDGTLNDWYKYERISFLQDEHGRPTHVHFAVIDSTKHDDLPNDIHNSKLIILPMRKARLLEVVTGEMHPTKAVRIKIKAEPGFDPHTDVDVGSLTFGASSEVNYGRGSSAFKSEEAGNDLVVSFDGPSCGFDESHFAGKLLGRTTTGELLFGWAGLPGAGSAVPLLSPLSPKFEFTDAGLEAYVEVTNFGELPSKTSAVKLMAGDKLLAEGKARPLKPFEKSIVRLMCDGTLRPGSKVETTVVVESRGFPTESFTQRVTIPGRRED